MKSKSGLVIVAGVIVVLILSGCATCRMAEPSIAELNAVSQFKKKLAVIGISDDASQIKGVGDIAITNVESLLFRQFTLLERTRINSVIAERDFMISEDPRKAVELGKMLGVDYLVFGTAAASISEPRVSQSSNTDSKGKFAGSILKQQTVQSVITLKIVDVATGLVVFSDKRGANFTQDIYSQSFEDQNAFNEAVKTAYLVSNIREVLGNFAKMNKEDSAYVSSGIAQAVESFRGALTGLFPYKGQILEKISEKEVLINLGSAYGIRPGDRLVVYRQLPARVDPNTGMAIDERIPGVFLTVKDVTSGISCTAKGKASDIRGLEIGTVVSTAGAR
ncbi:MAG: hypothetical protein HQL30_02975 [Candidatus Omnitrophica bacterium]|nr:hypothetical protein [Candidatus Omnitrophota bacterium]